MRSPYPVTETALRRKGLAAVNCSHEPAVLLLASQRVRSLPSTAMLAARLLPDCVEAVAVTLIADAEEEDTEYATDEVELPDVLLDEDVWAQTA